MNTKHYKYYESTVFMSDDEKAGWVFIPLTILTVVMTAMIGTGVVGWVAALSIVGATMFTITNTIFFRMFLPAWIKGYYRIGAKGGEGWESAERLIKNYTILMGLDLHRKADVELRQTTVKAVKDFGANIHKQIKSGYPEQIDHPELGNLVDILHDLVLKFKAEHKTVSTDSVQKLREEIAAYDEVEKYINTIT